MIDEKHGEEDEEETLSGDGEQDAGAEPPVARPRRVAFLQWDWMGGGHGVRTRSANRE